MSKGACDATGQCVCKEGVTGVKCSVCEVIRELFLPTLLVYDYMLLLLEKDGFYILFPDDASSCQSCGCSLSSSVSWTCDKISGQCTCKSGLTGRTCDIIEDFHWLPFLEGLIYEAEFAVLSVN